jgi:ABC-type lipoprotein release transport system permease subunit
MKIAFVIAARNLLRHKGKSFVIGAILFVGALIMTLGNAVISGMNQGLSENIVERFTGHIVLISDTQENPNILFTPMGKDIALIKNFDKTRAVLSGQSYIQNYLPAARGFSFVLTEDGDIDFALLLGVDFPEYNRMFRGNVQLVEGKLLDKNERGMLVSQGRRTRFFNDQNIWVKPVGFPLDEKNFSDEAKKYRDKMIVKDSLVLMGASGESTAFDVRTEIKGIHRYEFLDDFWKFFNIMDIETFRECFQWVTNSDAAVNLNKETKSLITNEGNLDDLFKEETVVKTKSAKAELTKTLKSLKEKSTAMKPLTDAGAYNVVFFKLKEKEDLQKRTDDLNAALKAAGAASRAVTWQKAIGQLGEMAGIIRGALMGFVFFIFFVAIIIIMNTLSMAALERTAELGMMRAVGAQKRFVTVMFFIETACLAVVFGGLGIVLGAVAVPVLKAFHISAENNILQLLFGGKTFAPYLGVADILIGVVELTLVTVIASLYPIRVARRITPLDAISRD